MAKKEATSPTVSLHMGQLRLLRVLYQSRGWLDRATLCDRAGISGTSGTFTATMNGIREGSSSGKARMGLVAAGLVEREERDIDGEWILCYRITDAGREALRERGLNKGEIPPPRDAALATNKRYQG